MPYRVLLGTLVLILAAVACSSPISLVPSEPIPDQQYPQGAEPVSPSATPFIAESYPTAGAESIFTKPACQRD